MNRLPLGGGAALVVALALAPSALARPADVVITNESIATTVTNTVKVSTTPSAPSALNTGLNMSNGVGLASTTLYTVPAGKDFVITSWSGYMGRTDGVAVKPRYAILTLDGATLLNAELVTNNPAWYGWTYPVTAIARSTITPQFQREDTSGSVFGYVTVLGYLVDETTGVAASAAKTQALPTAPTGIPGQ